MSGVTVITCTGGRELAFALCERWMARQTYRGDIQWICVDDVATPTPCTMGQTVIRPVPAWTPGENTLARNLLAAFPHVKHDKVVFWEDDDFYAPGYLQAMADALDRAPLAGEFPACYYNILTRQYWTGSEHPHHASLCQTAIRAEMIPALAEMCKRRRDHIDINFWRESKADKFWVRDAGCVGIKGLPGRPGIGMGHRPRFWWPHDSDGSMLRAWIGEDVAAYWRYMEMPAAS